MKDDPERLALELTKSPDYRVLRRLESTYSGGTAVRGTVRRAAILDTETTGLDAPKVTHVVLAQPTVSQVLYEQMVGRGLRGEKFGGTPTCHVIDLEDNYRSERPELGYKRFRALWAAPTNSLRRE